LAQSQEHVQLRSIYSSIMQKSATKPWQILLYYKYIAIAQPEKFAYNHLKLCKKLGLKGRVLIANEGINGTVGGPQEATNEYMKLMHADPRFKTMEFKISEGAPQTFKKIFVRYRPELVTLNLKEKIDPHKAGGTYLEPEELKNMYDAHENFTIIDMRNDYEAKIGRFKNAVTLKMKVFKELPKIVKKNLHKFRDQKIVTYCTGGIRCEKASALLKKNGFKNVYQLHGGVARFGQKFPDNYFEGKLFVFDERMAVPINSPGQEKVIACCLHCQKPFDDYINCINAECNKLIILCPDCRIEWNNACSRACAKKPRPLTASKNLIQI